MKLDKWRVGVDVAAANWQDAARAAGALLVEDGLVIPAFIDDMIATVKKFGPYMIPVPDVAFFHGPPSSHVVRTGLAFVTLKEPVYFEEFEGQRIKAAFAFGAVDQDSHFEMLAEVVALLQDKVFLSLATSGGSREELVARMDEVIGKQQEQKQEDA